MVAEQTLLQSQEENWQRERQEARQEEKQRRQRERLEGEERRQRERQEEEERQQIERQEEEVERRQRERQAVEVERRQRERQEDAERFQAQPNGVTQGDVGQNNDRMEGENTERQVKHPPVPRPTTLDKDVTSSRFLSWRQAYNDYGTLQKVQDATMEI